MIKGQSKTESMYRAIDKDSYSSLKEFSLDRRKYFKKYIVGETVEDKESSASVMGKLVETLLFEKEKFDSYFHLSSVKAPTGMLIDFIDALCKHTLASIDEQTGETTQDFETLTRLAYAESGYKISYERVMGMFTGKDAEIYFTESMTVVVNKLTIVDINSVSVAQTIVDNLKINEFVADIVNQETDPEEEIEVYNQLKVDAYEVYGHLLKSMLDKVIIYHKQKLIQFYDLKCTWDSEGFYENYYLKRRAYLQGLLYKFALEHVIKTHPELKGYKIGNPKFLVCDSNGFYGATVREMDDKDLYDAEYGFENRYRKYPGLKSIIQELQWCLDNNIWNYGKTIFEKGAHLNIKD